MSNEVWDWSSVVICVVLIIQLGGIRGELQRIRQLLSGIFDNTRKL